MQYQYPLHMSFKLIALAPQIYVRDANGNDLLYVRQKLLKLKEDVRIFRDPSQSQELYRINADRILDFSANYHFTDSTMDQKLGSIKHKGLRSIWKATYLVFDANEQQTHDIREDNPWVKVLDALLGEVPIVGFFAGYLFHPAYTASEVATDRPVLRLVKKPSFWERTYEVEALATDIRPEEEKRLLLSFMMMLQLERSRG